MTPCTKENDIDEIKKDVKSILSIMNGNGQIGLCAQVEINKFNLKELKKKPGNIKNWFVAGAIILNTAVAAASLLKG